MAAKLLLHLLCSTSKPPLIIMPRHSLSNSTTRTLTSLVTPPHNTPHTPPAPIDISYPAYMIWGANTNVGKTLVSTGLSTSVLCTDSPLGTDGANNSRKSKMGLPSNVLYVKPIQTGFPKDSDSDFVAQKVSQVLLSRSSAAPKKLFVSSYIQKVSASVSESKLHCDNDTRSSSKLQTHIDKINIKHVESYGMKDLFLYKGHVLEVDDTQKQRYRDVILADNEQTQMATASNLTCTTMWSWHDAVSPHLAAAQEDSSVSDQSVLQSLRIALSNFRQGITDCDIESQSSEKLRHWALIETAGGVASPGPSGTLQCDLYRPLRLPGVLVGDGKLGGISSTIAAYESLQVRGYDVAVIVLADNGLANDKFLLHHLHHRVPVLTLPSIPHDSSDNLVNWFRNSSGVFSVLRQVLESDHLKRVERLQEMPKKAGQLLWWPFTQHSHVSEDKITLIDSRYGDYFSVYKETMQSKMIMQQFDACASWWTQGPDATLQLELAQQIAYTAGRFGHVMLPENVHEPVLRCAELLLEKVGRGWADRVYFSDNGSTAIEIALKMAFRKYLADKNWLSKTSSEMLSMENKCDLRVLALQGSYHGDTLGAQDAQAPSAYVGFLQQPWYQGRGLFLEPPCIYMHNRQWHVRVPTCYSNVDSGDLIWSTRDSFYHERREKSRLATIYTEYILQQLSTETSSLVGALIMEPVVHAAGGMNFIDPLFQRLLVKECKAKRIPVIFDEVFSGCWRLGVQSAAELIGCTPDIACYSKLLTGGTVPLAATLASRHVFEAFEGQSKLSALLHGHSYSGHAIGCQAAITSLQWFSNTEQNPNLVAGGCRLKELWDPDIVVEISAHAAVERVMSLGTVFALEIKTRTSRMGYSSMSSQGIVQALREEGVYVRPLGNVVYLMCGPMTSPCTCSRLLLMLLRQLDLHSDILNVHDRDSDKHF